MHQYMIEIDNKSMNDMKADRDLATLERITDKIFNLTYEELRALRPS